MTFALYHNPILKNLCDICAYAKKQPDTKPRSNILRDFSHASSGFDGICFKVNHIANQPPSFFFLTRQILIKPYCVITLT